MLKALYDYGIRNNLEQPPGFTQKTIKAYISLFDYDDRVYVYTCDGEPELCPDIGSLANGTEKSNVIAEKCSVVIPEQAGTKVTPKVRQIFVANCSSY